MECLNAFLVTTMDQNSPISMWDSGTGTAIAYYRGCGSVPRHCISVAGGCLYASERGKPLIHCWPLNKQHCESKRLIAPGKIDCFDFSTDASHVAVAVSEKLHLYQTSSGRMIGTAAAHYQPISVVKFNAAGSLIACGGQDGMISVWTLANLIDGSDPLFSSMDHNLPIGDLCFTSGGLRARIISISADFTCKVFELATGRLLLSLAFPSRPTSLALSPNETTLFVGNSDGGIFESNLFDKPRKIAEYYQPSDDKDSTFSGHEKLISCLACTKDSVYLISGSHDESVRIWHISSHQCLRKLSQKGPVTNLMFRAFSSKDFSSTFKPSVRVQSFINPSNEEALNDTGFEITITDDQLLEKNVLQKGISYNFVTQLPATDGPASSTAGEREAHLVLEVNKLKQINAEMFKYALQTVLDGPTGVADRNVVPFSNVKKKPKLSKAKKTIKAPKTEESRQNEKLRNKKRKKRKLLKIKQAKKAA